MSRHTFLPLLAALVLTGVVTSGCASRAPEPGLVGPVATLTRGDVDLPYTVVVPAQDGCAAHSVASPAPGRGPASGPFVPLGEDAHVVLACLGPVGQVGTAEEVATAMAETGEGPAGDVAGPVGTRSPYGEALRVDRTFATSEVRLTEWVTEHAGYVYSVGYLRPAAAADRTSTVEAMLAAWRWE